MHTIRINHWNSSKCSNVPQLNCICDINSRREITSFYKNTPVKYALVSTKLGKLETAITIIRIVIVT